MSGDIVQAEDYLHEALSQRRQGLSGDADLWPVLSTLAEIIRGSGDNERAIGWLSQALDVALLKLGVLRDRGQVGRLLPEGAHPLLHDMPK